MISVPTTYDVTATNLSWSSENRIHDDVIAQGLGFAGALVPGVEIYAYACHLIGRHWGRDWLERGTASCRFTKPVYDGDIASVRTQSASPDGLSISVESNGIICASLDAALDAPGRTPMLADFVEHPIPSERPAASESALAEGTWLGTVSLDVTRERADAYLAAIHEIDPLYAAEGFVHPGQILRLCNQSLIQNVVLGVWIHTGSTIRNFSAARVGETLSVRAKVIANYDHRGHRCVDLDSLVLADAARPIARVLHKAIYRLRTKTPTETKQTT